MLDNLPLEIQVRLLKLCPTSSLKYVNSHFYFLYNDLYYDKLIRVFGEDVIDIIAKVYPWLRTYIKMLDAFRQRSREVISTRLKLYDYKGKSGILPSEIIHAMYVKDSWRYVYSLFKNKRLFAEYSDYKIDEPTNYVFNHYVEINRSYLLSYNKAVWLAPGTYNLNIGLVIKSGRGLGTTKFDLKYTNEEGEVITQTFYPPTNINEILPKRQFCFLKIGEFHVREPMHCKGDEGFSRHGKLQKLELTMEEIGLYLKSGFRIFFIDISQPSMLFNDYDLLYYSCQETNYKYFINLPLKNFYKALNHVQNGAHDAIEKRDYGTGDPNDIIDQFDNIFPDDFQSTSEESFEENLMGYAKFYFHNNFNRRSYKFNTIYQRRQFVNRFGDYELDDRDNEAQKPRCSYDARGLKWRIPILGEL
uniref:Uncharacterized protein n=1 Tax=Candidozyma auris TaxID=498019 RepID=A0A0L0NX17_CANAR